MGVCQSASQLWGHPAVGADFTEWSQHTVITWPFTTQQCTRALLTQPYPCPACWAMQLIAVLALSEDELPSLDARAHALRLFDAMLTTQVGSQGPASLVPPNQDMSMPHALCPCTPALD